MALNNAGHPAPRPGQPLTHRPLEGLQGNSMRLPPHTPRPQMVTTPPSLAPKSEPRPEPAAANDAPSSSPPSNVTRHPSSPPPPPPLAPYGELTQTERAVRKAATLAAVNAGMRQVDAAGKFNVPQPTISGWITRPELNAKKARAAAKAPEAPSAAPASARKAPVGPLARLDAIYEDLQASLEKTTLALRELDEMRTAFRQLFGG